MYEGPSYKVGPFIGSLQNEDCQLNVMCNSTRFLIHLSSEKFDDCPSIKEEYLHGLKLALAFDLEDEDEEETEEDFYDWVIEPLLPLFHKMEPVTKGGMFTLQDYLFPPTINYSLRAAGGERVPFILKTPPEDTPLWGIRMSHEFYSSIPSYYPSEIKVCVDDSKIGSTYIPRKVVFGENQLAFYKVYRPGDDRAARHELETYRKIHEAELDDDLRVSRLCGLVCEAGTNRILGLLLSYIDCGSRTLWCAKRPEVSRSLREKWGTQVTHTLACLHKAGIIWGDVKPDNVLIDRNNDAWLVDFGGSHTPSWVDRELAETVEGDEQGLTRIIEFLRVSNRGGH